jgi:hypothetical protein
MATQSPQNEKRSIVCMEALGLALVALGGFWLWSHTHRTQLGPRAPATGVASRLAGEAQPTLASAPQFASASDTNGRPMWPDSFKFALGFVKAADRCERATRSNRGHAEGRSGPPRHDRGSYR